VFILTGLGAMAAVRTIWAGVLCAGMMGAAMVGLWWLWRRPTREKAFEDGCAPLAADISVPLPDHLKMQPAGEGFHIQYWPKAFVNKATLLIVGGAILIGVDPKFGWVTALGVLFLARAVLMFSLFFGGGTCVTASAECLTVHSLLGKGSIDWRDITNVYQKTMDRRDYWTMLSAGSRKVIVVSGYHRNGTGELLIPYELLGLDDLGTRDLIRRIMLKAELKRAEPEPPHIPAARAAATFFAPEPEENKGFDPDAIMARYLAEREQQRGPAHHAPLHHQPQAQPTPQQHQPQHFAPQRIGGFGRKGVTRA
jgi:hypothetical protein